MSHRTVAAVAVGLTVGSLGLSVIEPASAAVAPAKAVHATTVSNAVAHSVRLPRGAHVLGRLAPKAVVSGEVVLKLRNQVRFAQLVAKLGSNHHSAKPLLAPGQFTREFAPTTVSLGSVKSALHRLGLSVASVSSDRLLVHVSGPSATVGTVLGTSFEQVRLANGTSGYTNVAAPTVPTALRSTVSSVVGLSSIVQVHTLGVPNIPHHLLRSHATMPAPCAAGSTASATGPSLAGAYGINSLASSGLTGAGVTVAVAEIGKYLPSAVSTFDACYGISPSLSTVAVLGGATTTGGKTQIEADVDIEILNQLAPGAAVIDYHAPSTGTLDIYNQVIADNKASVLAISLGICEFQLTSQPGWVQTENTIFQVAALQGQTVLAASGDTGSTCQSANTILDPAAQPFVTAVGGTQLGSPANYTQPPNETAWASSGGGVSQIWQAPCFQLSAIGSSTPCAVVNGANGDTYIGSATAMRQSPDVSALAGTPGYALYEPAACSGWCGGTTRVYGTSLSTPLWGAIAALANQQCGHVGFINPILYANANAFNDITSGSNGLYSAVAGYDKVTGLGSPKAQLLEPLLCGAHISADGTGTAVVAPAAVAAGTSTSLTFTYSAPATGITDGTLVVGIPAGWTAPSTSSTAIGYTTASAGSVAVSGQTILVSGFNLAPGGIETIVYGAAGRAVAVPAGAVTSQIAVLESAVTRTPVALAAQPTLFVSPVSTTKVVASPPTAAVGATVTLTATVAPTDGAGKVSFATASGSISGCGAAAVSAAGTATCVTTALPVGTNVVSATFSGDAGSATSTGSTSVTITTAAKPTTTTLTSSPASPTYGSTVTLTATVAPTDGGGTVSFANSGVAIPGCQTLATTVAGVATCSTKLAAGTSAIAASFTGDTLYGASSGSTNVTVAKASTTTTLSALPTSATSGSSVTLTATVSPTDGAGTVTFSVGTVAIAGCSASAVTASGTATCTTTSLAVGSDVVSAAYSVDTNLAAATGTTTVTITAPTLTPTTTTVVTSAASVVYGTTVTLTATVAPTDGAGTVTFSVGTVAIAGCSAIAVSATGVATCKTAALGVGTNTITASYSGDTKEAASAGTVSQTITKAATTTALNVSSTSFKFGTNLTLTAQVTPATAGGTVTFFTGTTAISGCRALASTTTGAVSCSTTKLAVGSNVVKATFNGSAQYNTSTSLTIKITVAKAVTITTLAAPTSAVHATAVTFSATVAPTDGAGTMTFTTVIAKKTVTLCANVVVSSVGVATCKTSSLTATGTFTVTAAFAGDTNCAASTGSKSIKIT